MRELYTIGHSTHLVQRCIELLAMHTISAIADVRSSPFSRFNPQFNREPFQRDLRAAHIEYVFMGKELGARSPFPQCYIDGKVQFDLVAKTDLFKKGLERLEKGIDSFRTCLLCAEKDPLQCHRTILVCRHLRGRGVRIRHILEDGSIEEHTDAQRRLMREHHIQENDLFATDEELIDKAYDLRAKKIAWEDTGND
jgi:uncharacterized protein (DUF488 family)